ncbi:hypothetical protein ACFVH6_17530 [Spirillospora sp. NPDC127200]
MNIRRTRSDGGEGSIGYTAVILLVAVIVAALFATGVGWRVADALRVAICTVVNGGDASKCETAQDNAFKPNCTTRLSADSYSGLVDVLIFRVGRDYRFMRTTSIDPTTGQRTVRITALKGGTAGVGTGIGVGVNFRNINAGVDASADAAVRLGTGDAWEFTGPNAERDADKLESDIREQYSIDAVKENGGLLGQLGGGIYDAFAGPEIRDPDVIRYEGEFNLNGSLIAGLGVGPKDPKDPQKGDRHYEYKGRHRKPTVQDKVGEHDSRGSDGFSPNAQAWVSVDGTEKVIYEKNKKTGDTTVTTLLSGAASYGEQHVVDGNQGQRTAMGMMSLTTGPDGKLKKIAFTQTHIVNGRATVITTEVPLTTDADRRAVAEHLLNPLNSGGPGGQLLTLTWDDMAPTEDPGPDADPLKRLLYQKGKTAKVDYDYDQNDENYGASVKLGLKLGGNFGLTNSNRNVREAWYLGAAQPDGSRPYKEFAECR